MRRQIKEETAVPEREIGVQIGRKFPSFLAAALKMVQFPSELQAGGKKIDTVPE